MIFGNKFAIWSIEVEIDYEKGDDWTIYYDEENDYNHKWWSVH